METATHNCWCCDGGIIPDEKCAFPYICKACFDDKEHPKTEWQSDMFLAVLECTVTECKHKRHIRVNRSGARKLFNARERLRCKQCDKPTARLTLEKAELSTTSYTSNEEPILPAKEWRDKDPQKVAMG